MSATRIGRYEILRPLGRGAMGIVYLARDPAIDRVIALKTIRFDAPSPSFNREEAQARFLKEAKISGRLQHPHIVTIFDVGEDQGVLYLAMEFVSGGALSQKLTDPVPLPVGDRIRVVTEVADALAHAHERGVIHRDIKPANILLTESLSAKVTDFGIGKLLTGDSELTSTGQMVGSPAYMSPEQIRGEKVDVRSDIFSLGVVLYQAVTGKKPFPAESLTTLVFQILNQEPTDPLLHQADLPPELSQVLRRCLAKRRDDRYTDASLLAEDLRLLLGVAPVASTAALSESRARRVLAAAQAMAEPQATVNLGTLGNAPGTPPAVPASIPAPAAPLSASYPGVTAATSAMPTPPEAPRGVSASGTGSFGPRTTTGTGSRTAYGEPARRPLVVALVAAAGLVLLATAGYFAYRATMGAMGSFGGPGTEPTPVPSVPPPVVSPGGTVVPDVTPGPDGTPGAEPTPAVPVEVPTETIRVVESPLPTRHVPPTPTPAYRPTATPVPTASPTPPPAATPTAAPLKTAHYTFVVRRSVKVNVSPSQARVFLDGRYIGISDDWDGKGGGALLAFSQEGKHRLRFAYPGYRDLLMDLVVAAGGVEDEIELDQEMSKGTPDGPTGPGGKLRGPNYRTQGVVNFQVDPPDAFVTLDGKALGPASKFAREPLILREMRVYDIILAAPGREGKELRVIVSPDADDDTAEIKEKLKPQ